MMETKRLVTQLIQKVEAIDFIVSKQQELSFPSDRPLRLAHVILNVARLVKQEVVAQYVVGIKPSAEETFQDQVKFAINAVHIMGSHLRFVDRSTTRQTPWSLIRPLEKIGERIHPGCCFVIRPQWNYNYSIRELVPTYRNWFSTWLPNDRLEEALSLSSDGSVEKLYIMGFPYVERLNVLMHTLLGHEIGHPIEKEYFLGENSPEIIENITQSVLKTRSLPGDLQTLDIFEAAQVVNMRDRVYRLRHRAIAELICDLVAVHLFGLAALFSIEELALARELDRFQKEDVMGHYPPWRYRIRTVLEEFSPEWIERFVHISEFDPDVSGAIKDKFDALTALVKNTDDIGQLTKDQETKIAYSSVQESMPLIRQFVRDRLANSGFRLDDLVSNANAKLLKRLEDWIPPDAYINEAREEIVGDIRSILNVGWIRWIHSYSCISSNLDNQEGTAAHLKQVNALERLILKALEYIDLRSTWEKRPVDGAV